MSNNNDKKVIHNIRTQVDSFGRKKYRLQEVQKSASQQQQNQNNALIDTGRHKSMLISRDEGLNIQKYVGKINTNKKKKASQVFYCDICSEGFKCDMAYITHLNSPAHNRKLGMNMKVKNVSLQTVSSKISALINKKQRKQQQEQEDQLIAKIQNKPKPNNRVPLPKRQPQNQSDQQNNEDGENEDNQQDDCKQEQGLKQQQKDNKQDNEQDNEQEQQDQDELAQLEMMKQMGIPTSFGSKKHKR